MPTSNREIRALARSHSRLAIKALAGIVRNEKATAAARVAAATVLLDRGWGKVIQPRASDEPAAPQPKFRIERYIVEPRWVNGELVPPVFNPRP
jgi:hypothetical protein